MSACGWHGCDWEQCPECTVYRATDRELVMLRDQQATLAQLLREETEAAERNREAYARKAAEVDQLRAQVAQLQVECAGACDLLREARCVCSHQDFRPPCSWCQRRAEALVG